MILELVPSIDLAPEPETTAKPRKLRHRIERDDSSPSQQIDQFINIHRPRTNSWTAEYLATKLGLWSIQYEACKTILENIGIKDLAKRKNPASQALIIRTLLNLTLRTPQGDTRRSPVILPQIWPMNGEQVKVLLLHLLNLSNTQKSTSKELQNLTHLSRQKQDQTTQAAPETMEFINSLREICLPFIQEIQNQATYEILIQILLQEDLVRLESRIREQFPAITEILWEKLKNYIFTNNIKPDQYFEHKVKQYLREITILTIEDHLKNHSQS